jgi:hypothetical protein
MRVDQARAGDRAARRDRGVDVPEDVHHHLDDLLPLRRLRRGVHQRVGRLAVDRPVLQRQAHHRQREHGRDDVREVIHEVDRAGHATGHFACISFAISPK